MLFCQLQFVTCLHTVSTAAKGPPGCSAATWRALLFRRFLELLYESIDLIWQQSGSEETMNYEMAKAYVDRFNRENFAGYNDWRLPTLEEAMSLMEPEKKNADLYIDPKFDRVQRWIWTADTESAAVVWVVDFYRGGCGPLYVADDYVRAVR